MRRPCVFTIVALVATVSVTPNAIAKDDSTSSIKRGQILSRQYYFKEAKKNMTYTLYVPSYYDSKVEWPLMVALHGLHSNPNQIIRYRGLTKLAEHYGYIIVAPMGYNTKGWYGAPQPFGRPNPPNLGELSEKDVMNVLAITRKKLNVNPRRIYLMGHSMGGGGTFHLGIKYGHIWAGIAPIAPAIFRDVEDLTRIKKMPIVMVQGDRDALVPVHIARLWAAKMRALRMDYKYIEVKGGGHVAIAWDYMPQIFEYLDKKRKPSPEEKKVPVKKSSK